MFNKSNTRRQTCVLVMCGLIQQVMVEKCSPVCCDVGCATTHTRQNDSLIKMNTYNGPQI